MSFIRELNWETGANNNWSRSGLPLTSHRLMPKIYVCYKLTNSFTTTTTTTTKMKHQIFMCLCVLALIIGVSNGADNLAQKCGQVVQKVIPCLDFATGKADAPKKECCDATNSIKETDPECLCYIIQQTHKGSPESKSMGIQEDKLLQLPSVCHVKDANITDCPKLLGLSPSSPDAAIFKNASKINPPASSSSSSASSTGTTTPTTPTPSSDSYNLRPVMITEVMMVTLAIVLGAIVTISI